MKQKLLFIVNVDWFFISHRLPVALEAQRRGYEVHVACQLTSHADYLESLGIFVHSLSLSRSGTGLLHELKVLMRIFAVVKQLKPTVMHMITIKGVIYGGLAGRFFNVKIRVASISGLGYVFIDQSGKARLIRQLVMRLYRLALSSSCMTVIFQNRSDEKVFTENRIVDKEQVVRIPGSGVDLSRFTAKPELSGKKVVMFLARLLKDKGLIEFCEAAKAFKNRDDVCFVLVGNTDPENPNSVSENELQVYLDEGIVDYWGYTGKVENTIPRSHIMVLPSYREGMPKSLLEAAACGRAIVTTDVPGCRDAIRSKVTGLLVPAKNIDALIDTIGLLVENDELRKSMGKEGRILAESCYDINNVIEKHMDIYNGGVHGREPNHLAPPPL